MYEIEIRGLLTSEEFLKLKELLEKEGKFEETFKRLSVEISPGFDSETRQWKDTGINLRIKKSDDEEKISLKYGDPYGEKLEEYEVKTKPGQFLTTLQLFSILGFDKGLIYFWESWVYEYQGSEVKISKYTDEYYMWEIESRDNDSEEKAKARVYELAEELGLKALSRDEYKEQIDYQCQNIFQLYTVENVTKILDSF